MTKTKEADEIKEETKQADPTPGLRVDGTVREGEPTAPSGIARGETSQRYDGETDPAQVIKARNIQRALDQAGLSPKPQAPAITELDPAEAVIGGADITLTVHGTAFTPGSLIVFNGGEEPTTVVSDTECSTIVKPSLASGPWTLPVLVRNAVGDSNALDFSFTEPAPLPEKAKGEGLPKSVNRR